MTFQTHAARERAGWVEETLSAATVRRMNPEESRQYAITTTGIIGAVELWTPYDVRREMLGGPKFHVLNLNASTRPIWIRDGVTTLQVVNPGELAFCFLIDNATALGTWDFHVRAFGAGTVLA